MHYFEGFTRTQYQTAINLSKFLTNSGLGKVHISTTFKFHGKLYSFIKSKSPYAAVIGSSNLSSLFNETGHTYETDLMIQENETVKEIDTVITKLFSSISDDIANIPIHNFKEFNPLLENHDKVKNIERNNLYSTR